MAKTCMTEREVKRRATVSKFAVDIPEGTGCRPTGVAAAILRERAGNPGVVELNARQS